MGISNAQLGKAIGVTASYASYLRNGRRTPSAKLLIKILDAYPSAFTTYEALRAFAEGSEAFSALLRERLFDAPDQGESIGAT